MRNELLDNQVLDAEVLVLNHVRDRPILSGDLDPFLKYLCLDFMIDLRFEILLGNS